MPDSGISLPFHSAQPHPLARRTTEYPSSAQRRRLSNRRISLQCPQWPTAQMQIPCVAQPQTSEYPCCAQPKILQRCLAVLQSLAAVFNFWVSVECRAPEQNYLNSQPHTSRPTTPTGVLGMYTCHVCRLAITLMMPANYKMVSW